MHEEQFKTCSKCNEKLPFSQYFKDKNNIFGISSQCKRCKNETTKLRRFNMSKMVLSICSDKKCPRCQLTKSSDCFTKLKTNKDGLSNYCKDCRKLNDKEQKLNASQTHVIVDETKSKTCTTCNLTKSFGEFRINRKSNDNLTHSCLQCLPKNNWTNEKQHESEKKYRMNNPDKMKEKYKKHGQNINCRIRSSLNHRISGALKTSNNKKKNKTIEYLGCNIYFLQKWIEFQFQENMTWENYGQWHFDHVKPCSSYNFSEKEQIKECFCWKNMQPLWKIDNLKKSNKIDIQYIETHCEKANNYEKENIIT